MSMARKHRRYFGHPCSRGGDTAHEHGPWTWVVHTELQWLFAWIFGMLVHLDTVWSSSKAQGHRSGFKVTGG